MRRALLIAISLYLILAMTCLYALTPIVRGSANYFLADMGFTINVRHVRLNLFTGYLQVDELVAESSDQTQTKIDHLALNLHLSAALIGHWFLESFELSGLRLTVTQQADLATIGGYAIPLTADSEEPDPEEVSELPWFGWNQLHLSDWQIDLKTPQIKKVIALKQWTIGALDSDTPDNSTSLSSRLQLLDSQIKLSGQISPLSQPIRATIHLELAGLPIQQLASVLPFPIRGLVDLNANLQLTMADQLNLKGDAHLRVADTHIQLPEPRSDIRVGNLEWVGSWQVAGEQLAVSAEGQSKIEQLKVTPHNWQQPLLSWQSLSLNPLSIRDSQQIIIDTVQLQKAQLQIHQNPDGSINVQNWLAANTEQTNASPAVTDNAVDVDGIETGEARDIQLTLGDLRVTSLQLQLPPSSETDDTPTPLHYQLQNVAISQSHIQLHSESLDTQVDLEQLTVGPLNSQAPQQASHLDSQWHLFGGAMRLQGQAQPLAQPISADLSVAIDKLQLAQLGGLSPMPIAGELSFNTDAQLQIGDEARGQGQAQLALQQLSVMVPEPSAHVKLQQLSWQGGWQLAPEGLPFAVTGQSSLQQLSLTPETWATPLAQWQQLSLEGIHVKGPQRVEVQKVALDGLKIKAQQNKDGVIDVNQWLATAEQTPADEDSNVAAESKTTDATAPSADEPQTSFLIGQFLLTNGQVDFLDQSIDPNLAMSVRELQVNMGALDSARPTENTDLNVSASLLEFGKLTVDGQGQWLNQPLVADLKTQLNALPLAPFSGYSQQFIGKHIEQGQFSLESQAKIANDEIDSKNTFIIERMKLGGDYRAEKQESLEGIGLPVNSLVSLFANNQEQLKFKIPITGPLAEPDVGTGDIIRQATLATLKGAAVYQLPPLAALSVLKVGWDLATAESFNVIPFPAGQWQLDEQGRQEIVAITQVMQQKPELKINICGVATPAEKASDHTERLWFAAKRSQEVKEKLLSAGINADRLFLCAPKVDERSGAKPLVLIKP